MLLVELTLPAAGLVRVSNEPLALAHYWRPSVASLGQLVWSMDQPYGGYVRPRYGLLELLPDLFTVDWPPPVSIPVTVMVTDSDEASARTILRATAHRTEIRRDGVTYQLYGPDYDGIFTDHAYANTVDALFTNNIPLADASLAADTSLADGAAAPAIHYTDAGEQVVIESLSRACACATHMFYVEGSTAYLVDMFADNGSSLLTGFDFFPSSYTDGKPYAVYRCGDIALTGSNSYGDDKRITPVFHDQASQAQQDYDTAVRELELAQASLDANPTDSDLIAARDAKQAAVDSAANTLANAQAADETEINKGLTRIKQILEMPRMTIKMPIVSEPPRPGERLSWVSDAMGQDLSGWMRVRALVWDFDNEQMVVEGEGSYT